MVLLEIVPTAAPPVQADSSIRWARQSDLPLLKGFGHDTALLESRFAAGAIACMVTGEGRLLGYVWFRDRHHDEEELGVRFHVADGDVWLFDAMVAPDQRGRGLYTRLLCTAVRDLGRDGARRILIAIDASNRNSLRAHVAAGAREIGRIRVLRMMGFTVLHDGRALRAAWAGTSRRLLVSTAKYPSRIR